MKATASILSKLRAAGIAEQIVAKAIRRHWGALSRSSVFVEGSVEVVAPDHGDDVWIEFKLDEQRSDRWFRVVYDVSLTPALRPREITCSSPSGCMLENYGWTVGKMPVLTTA